MKKCTINNNVINNIIIIILILLSITEIIPIVLTIFIPSLCYGCTSIGKLQQYLNSKYNLGYISSIAFILLIIYFIYLCTLFKNNYIKYSFIFLLFCLIYISTIPILNIFSIILTLHYHNPPFIKNYYDIFPSSINIEKNANMIIHEFNNYIKDNKPDCIRKLNPGFKIEINNTENTENCWRALYLKKIGVIDNNLKKYFPNTLNLLHDDQIHNAFFSILDPGVEIPPHVGYYKGYLRYHLGIIIPNNNTNNINDKAYIVCGEEKYIWKQKKGIVFDDIYLHHVKNPTNQLRVVFYIDVIRKSNNIIFEKINNLGIFYIENSVALNYFLKNQHTQNKIHDLE